MPYFLHTTEISNKFWLAHNGFVLTRSGMCARVRCCCHYGYPPCAAHAHALPIQRSQMQTLRQNGRKTQKGKKEQRDQAFASLCHSGCILLFLFSLVAWISMCGQQCVGWDGLQCADGARSIVSANNRIDKRVTKCRMWMRMKKEVTEEERIADCG